MNRPNFSAVISPARLLLLSLPSLAATLHAGVLVNLDATALPAGPITSWTNTGSLGGSFAATGAPAVAVTDGVKGVNLEGDYFVGPAAPAAVTGVNPNRSIEVWSYNATLTGEETMVAWGRRGGGDGTNIAFNYSTDAGYGAVGHWGAGPDIGWNGAPAAGVWHYLVYTYDGGGVAGAGTCRVYADGVLKNSEVQGALNTHGPPLPFILGGQNDPTGNPLVFNSGLTLGRIRVHDTVLGVDQIQDTYAAELPTFRPGQTFVPGPYLVSSRLVAPSSFEFKVNDRVASPASTLAPATFNVLSGPGPVKWSFNTTRKVWEVLGGEGNIFGGIITPETTVPGPGPVELSLTHRYNFEGDLYDGGIVEVSINGGPYKVLEGANFSQNGYIADRLIGNGYLIGQRAWNAASDGFDAGTPITSVATIPGLVAGDKIRVRFMGNWDDGFTPDGIDWEISGVKIKAGAVVMMDEKFSTGNGGFTNFSSNEPSSIGTLSATKAGEVTTFTFTANWVQRGNFAFVLAGKDTGGRDLSFSSSFAVPGQNLAASRQWPVSIPGPAGSAGTWGVRTYLNEGINGAENASAMLDFLANAADRTPTLTPETVVDSQEKDLSFRDPESNAGADGPHGTMRPFPANTPADDNHVITSAHGSIQITEAGDYTFSLRGDDGFFFRVAAASGAMPQFSNVGGNGIIDSFERNVLYFPGGTGDSDTRGIMRLEVGVYKLEYAQWEGVGGFFYQVAAAKGAFLNQADTTSWRLIGYVTPPPPAITMAGDWTVLTTAPSGLTVATIPGADAAVDAAVAADAAAATSSWPLINFNDPQSGGTGRIGGDVPWPRNTAADDNNYAMRMAGTLRINTAGSYLIGFQGDDGTRLTVGGVNGGFTELTENVTAAGVIGKGNNVMANSGSAGMAGNSTSDTAATLGGNGAIAGDSNKSITLGPTATRVTIPFNAAFNPKTLNGELAPFTVEAWVNPTSLAGGAQAVVNSMIAGLQQNSANTNDRSGYVLRMNNGDWQFYLGRNETIGGAVTNFYDILTAPGTVLEAQWQHVAGVFDGTKSYLYVNGVEVANQTVSQAEGRLKANDAAPLLLGDRGFGGWVMKGGLDDVAIYSGALTPAVIASHYANGVNPARATPYSTLVQAANPTGYWRLGEAIAPRIELGTITTDFSTGNSSTVGRIFLNAGDYPISATYFEGGGGSYFEIFSAIDEPTPSFKGLGKPADSPGLPLVSGPTPPPAPVIVGGGLVLNPNSTLSVTFQSVVGTGYGLEASTTLGGWLEISSLVATGTTSSFNGTVGGTFAYDPAKPRQYFRIRVK